MAGETVADNMPEHSNMIRGLVPKGRLLEWCVEDGWAPLCEFLDKPIPKEPFPHANQAAGWDGMEQKFAKRYVTDALQNTGIALMVLIGGWYLTKSFIV